MTLRSPRSTSKSDHRFAQRLALRGGEEVPLDLGRGASKQRTIVEPFRMCEQCRATSMSSSNAPISSSEKREAPPINRSVMRVGISMRRALAPELSAASSSSMSGNVRVMQCADNAPETPTRNPAGAVNKSLRRGEARRLIIDECSISSAAKSPASRLRPRRDLVEARL